MRTCILQVVVRLRQRTHPREPRHRVDAEYDDVVPERPLVPGLWRHLRLGHWCYGDVYVPVLVSVVAVTFRFEDIREYRCPRHHVAVRLTRRDVIVTGQRPCMNTSCCYDDGRRRRK